MCLRLSSLNMKKTSPANKLHRRKHKMEADFEICEHYFIVQRLNLV